MKKKRKSNSGETLVESLASILLIALATAMFLSFTMAAGKLTERAKKREERFYEAVSFLEGMEEISGEKTFGEEAAGAEMDREKAAEGIDSGQEYEKNDRSVRPGTLTVSIQSEHGRIKKTEQFSVQVYEDGGMISYRWIPWEEYLP